MFYELELNLISHNHKGIMISFGKLVITCLKLGKDNVPTYQHFEGKQYESEESKLLCLTFLLYSSLGMPKW